MATATGELVATEAAAARAPVTTAAESFESDTPTIETAAYTRTLERLERNRDVYAGPEAIRRGGEKYVPKFKGESARQYESRRTISTPLNAHARTVEAIVGIVCDPEPTLSDDMPQELKDMWENFDGAGTHGAVFTRRLETRAVVDGFAGILTEYPRLADVDVQRPGVSAAAAIAIRDGLPLDPADIKALRLAPYAILVKVDECLPIYESLNGKKTLVMFIRKETSAKKKGRFGTEPLVRFYVYELIGDKVFYERWVEENGQKRQDIKPTEMKNLTAIPWAPLALGKELGDHEYRPLLDDLAFLTITHHRIQTGRLSLVENACVPTKYRVGAPKDSKKGTYPELVIGLEEVIEIPFPPQGVTMPSPPVGFLSPPVDVLEPSEKVLDKLETHMGIMGAAFIAPQPVQETATAERMDRTAEQASVSSISRDTKDCLELTFGFAGQYVGKKAGSVTMNADFVGEGVDFQVLAILVTNYQSDKPIVELADIRHYLQTGQLPEDFDPGDTLNLIALANKAAADKAAQTRDILAFAAKGASDANTNSNPQDNAA